MICTHNQKTTWWNCWWKHLLHLLGLYDQRQPPWPATACHRPWGKQFASPFTFCLSFPLKTTTKYMHMVQHLLACCSVFLVLSSAAFCGGMLINPSLLGQTMACFLVTASILWPLSHVEKLPRKGQFLQASCLPGDSSSSIYPDYLCDSEKWLSGNGNDCIKRIWDLCQIFYWEVALPPARIETKEFRGCVLHPPSCSGLTLVQCQTPTKASLSLPSAAGQGGEEKTKGWDKDSK